MARIGKYTSYSKRRNNSTNGIDIADAFPVGSTIVSDTGEFDDFVNESTGNNTIDGQVDDGSVRFIDPETAAAGNGSSGNGTGESSSTGKRRGRPRGSRNAKQTRREETETQKTLGALLFSGHMMMASFIKVPELMLSEDEANKLGDAVNRVAALYDLPIFNEKTQAWIHLGFVAAGVYGPRAVAYHANHKPKKREPIPIAAVKPSYNPPVSPAYEPVNTQQNIADAFLHTPR